MSLISSNLIKTSAPQLRQSHAAARGYCRGAAYLPENKWKLIQRAQGLADKAGEALEGGHEEMRLSQRQPGLENPTSSLQWQLKDKSHGPSKAVEVSHSNLNHWM